MVQNLKQKINSVTLPWILLALIILSAGTFSAVKFKKINTLTLKNSQLLGTTTAPQDKYIAFTDEVFGIIQTNYWNKVPEADLANLYLLATQKIASSTTLTLTTADKAGVDKLMQTVLAGKTDDEKKTLVSGINDVVLANLAPFGRSRLYSQKLIQDLSNQVNNIDTSTNLYNDLGVDKNATPEQVNDAYQKKSEELKKQDTPEAKEKLALVERAHEALKAPETKQKYDQTGAEPAVTYRLLDRETFYLKISRFVPDLVAQFQAAAKTVDNEPASLNTLVLDLRGNIGGAIDQLPIFLGPFLGQKQYAFEYFRQGEYLPYKTQGGYIPELVRYKKVIILVDHDTQSSAEVLAGSLKKYNVGILVGTTTKGHGTIERVFEIKNQLDPSELYAAFLVHTLTLADDNEPIEGRGIMPQIDLNSKTWEKDFTAYFEKPTLLQQVKKLVGK